MIINVFCGVVSGVLSSSLANPTDVLKVILNLPPPNILLILFLSEDVKEHQSLFVTLSSCSRSECRHRAVCFRAA